MFPFAPFVLLLASSIAASPVEIRDSLITLPIARRLNTSGGTINLLQYDLARVAALKDRSASSNGHQFSSISATNDAVIYIAKVGVGSPATTCKSNLRK